MHETWRDGRTVEEFAIERVYDGITRLLGIHACETDSSTGALRIAQYPRGNDFSVRREHRFQVYFAHVRRQVGDVEIGRVLLLLLKQTEYALQYIYTAVWWGKSNPPDNEWNEWNKSAVI